MEVGRDEVTLRTGKQANKRNIQFAHQALLALFGKLANSVVPLLPLWTSHFAFRKALIVVFFSGGFEVSTVFACFLVACLCVVQFIARVSFLFEQTPRRPQRA